MLQVNSLESSGLITPFSLVTNPVTIDPQVLSYDHESQTSSSAHSGLISASFMTTTYNGTRTYDYRGQPNDSDHDSDEQ